MKVKQILILLVFTLSLIALGRSCNYRLWMLKNKELTYKELPMEVKKCLANKLESFDITDSYILFVNESDSSNYKAESVGYIWGPQSWIAYIKLIDIKKNIVYRINRDVSEPYIIFENRLYIPKEYNIRWNYDKILYNEYELK